MTTIAEAFARETDPERIAAMLSEFALEAIKRFGPEYLAMREILAIHTGLRNN